jgi:transitional endoplasmic reticulum ATPase
MKTANLYAPAVVFFEDIDVLAEKGDPEAVNRLLDLFDSITNKGAEIVCILTTNHVDRIHKAMLRPGRLDSVIHIGSLDEGGYERLVKALVPTHLLADDIDYHHVSAAFEGFFPAFAKEAVDRAMRYAIDRTGGFPETITTYDLVEAAQGLRPQLLLMESATEGQRSDTLSGALQRVVEEGLSGTKVMDDDDYAQYRLVPEAISNGG